MATPAQDLNSKFSGTAKSIDKGLKSATETLEDISHTVGERAGEMASQVGDYYKTSTKYVKENPVKGVAIAAATGVVVGSLLTMAFRGNGKA